MVGKSNAGHNLVVKRLSAFPSGVIVSLFLVNRFGRRPLLLHTMVFMTGTLCEFAQGYLHVIVMSAEDLYSACLFSGRWWSRGGS